MIRVTELLKYFELYKGLEFITEDNKERGNILHYAVENYKKHCIELELNDTLYNKYMQFIKFLGDFKLEILHQEFRINNEILGITGQIDIVGKDNKDNIYILDVKSSLSKQPAYRIQTALYAILYSYQNQIVAQHNIKRGIIMLDTDKYQLEWHNDNKDISVAISLINVYNFKKENGLIKE